MKLLDKLNAEPSPQSSERRKWGAFKSGPGDTEEFRRIVALPRRILDISEAVADEWTARFRTPSGTMRLRPYQAAALADAERALGLLGVMGVGSGKTLVSLLLHSVWKSRRTVLLVPPKLKSKLFELELPELSEHWKLPQVVNAAKHEGAYVDGAIYVVSYTDLSNPRRSTLLENIQPDVVIADEGHALRHFTAACTKRWWHYVTHGLGRIPSADPVAGTPRKLCAVLSGTITSGPISDFAHLAEACLGNGSPVPTDYRTLVEWGSVVDPTDEIPAPPGRLADLCLDGEPIRSGFRRRLVETPGVVATEDNRIPTGLVFRRLVPKLDAALKAALKQARQGIRPDGEFLQEALDVYACTRRLSMGFYYRHIYPCGEPLEVREAWFQARRDYFSEARARLARSIPGQDSEALLRAAIERGEWNSRYYARWAELEPTVQPEQEAVWVSRCVVDAAVKWAHEAPGIVWVEAEAVKAVMAVTDLPVYADGDDALALYKEDGSRSVVASIQAFKEGANLQAFNRNLILACPANAALLEQAIGRTHRFGQKADEVFVDFFLHTPELEAALVDARRKAAAITENVGNYQKLYVGTWTF